MAVDFPNTPTNGDSHTEEGLTWVYQDPPGAWVVALHPWGVQEYHDPVGDESYRIIGSTLECWGRIGVAPIGNNGRTYTFPKTFKYPPTVTTTWVGDTPSQNDGRTDWLNNITTTGFSTQVRLFVSSSVTGNTGPSRWYAVGEWDGAS